jgi:hypothetical protein
MWASYRISWLIIFGGGGGRGGSCLPEFPDSKLKCAHNLVNGGKKKKKTQKYTHNFHA